MTTPYVKERIQGQTGYNIAKAFLEYAFHFVIMCAVQSRRAGLI